MKYEDKYLNRIASQHKIRPKYMAWLAALLEKIQDLHDLALQLDAAFDLDSAVGVQLDMIGQSVGVSRLLNFEPVYASARLSDKHYHTILRARISLNHWDGTTEGIYRLWDEIFDGYTLEVIDNQDMTMTLLVYGLKDMFDGEYISRGYAAPKPQGVGVNYEFLLSFTLDSSIYIGAKVANERTRFTWNRKTPAEDMDVNGELFSGGAIGNTRARFVLGDKPFFENRDMQGGLHTAGKITNAQSCFVLSSRDSPMIKDISSNFSAGGKMAVLHSSFALPRGKN